MTQHATLHSSRNNGSGYPLVVASHSSDQRSWGGPRICPIRPGPKMSENPDQIICPEWENY